MHRSRRQAALAAGLALAGAAAGAQDLAWSASAGLAHRHLEETAPDGSRLLTERGAVGVLQVQAERALAQGGALAGRLTLAGGDLDYDGRTQAGRPLTTTTRQTEGAVDILWRPHAPAAWGQAWLTGGLLANRRNIQGTAIAGGLDEVSTALFVGALWRSPDWAVGDRWRTRVEGEARVSVWHRLHVDYLGLLDNSQFRGAQRRQLVARLVGSQPGSPWEWALELSHIGQQASGAVPVYRRGAVFGTVRQPELYVRDVGLRVTRRF